MLQTNPSSYSGATPAVDEAIVRQLAIRRRILAVSKQRFSRFSYEGVSIVDIARSADVTLKELSVHFEDKRPILLAILEEGWDSINPRLMDIVQTSVSAREGMLSMLALMMNILQKDEDLARLLLCEGRRPDPESSENGFSKGYRRFMQLCTDLVALGQKDGSFRPTYHPQVVASMMIGAVEGLMRDRLAAEQENSITPYTGTYLLPVFDAMVSYLKP
jgi:AcrR family transcriptional regulator